MPEPTVAAIVLAGGEARRFGSDKLAAEHGTSTVLDSLLDGLPSDWHIVCVGPQRVTVTPAVWTREEPPGGGPVPAIAAGLNAVPAVCTRVVVLAGDQPNAANAAARLAAHLATAPGVVDAVVAVDGEGRRNPLLSAFRRDSLSSQLPDQPAGRAANSLLDGILVHDVPVGEEEQRDIDHPDDL